MDGSSKMIWKMIQLIQSSSLLDPRINGAMGILESPENHEHTIAEKRIDWATTSPQTKRRRLAANKFLEIEPASQ